MMGLNRLKVAEPQCGGCFLFTTKFQRISFDQSQKDGRLIQPRTHTVKI